MILIKQFYKSSAWLKKRQAIFMRDNNECQRCKELGKFSRAECVHHIKHLDKYPDLALVDENLVSLCNSCHNSWAHPEKLLKPEKNKFTNKERWE